PGGLAGTPRLPDGAENLARVHLGPRWVAELQAEIITTQRRRKFAPCACVASAPDLFPYLDGTASTRKPRESSAMPRSPPALAAAVQLSAGTFQLPPRSTRVEPSPSQTEEVHSQTFPWRSYMPRGFGKYKPASLG